MIEFSEYIVAFCDKYNSDLSKYKDLISIVQIIYDRYSYIYEQIIFDITSQEGLFVPSLYLKSLLIMYDKEMTEVYSIHAVKTFTQ